MINFKRGSQRTNRDMNDTIVINKQFFDEMLRNLKELTKYFQKPENEDQVKALSDAEFTLYMLESDDMVSSFVEHMSQQDFTYYANKQEFDSMWGDTAKMVDVEEPEHFPCMGKFVRYIENHDRRNEIAMLYIYEVEKVL